MTDEQVVTIDEAIRHCYEVYYERDDMCKECRDEHRQLAKWLEELKENREIINRQKAEIERLQKAGEETVNCFTRMESLYKIKCKELKVVKAETIKEFAKMLINKAHKGVIYALDIPDYAQEMVGEYSSENGPQRDYCQDEVVAETVGQYTGLTDKNGTKIFEGDIVAVNVGGRRTICIVSWAETVAHFRLWQINTIPKTPTNLNFGNYDCEVIGNIHDNPELMKGSE